MFNPLNLLSKFIKSSNQKELDRISKIVENVNSFVQISKLKLLIGINIVDYFESSRILGIELELVEVAQSVIIEHDAKPKDKVLTTMAVEFSRLVVG